MGFEFSTARRIVFGPGALREAGEIAAGLGTRPLLVTGSNSERAERLLALLKERGLDAVQFAASREPDIQLVRKATFRAREEQCDCVIGFGGGAAVDTAKAVAVMVTNEGDLLDYLEIVGRGKALTEPPVPLMAIPTTAGSGAEVTRNAVIVSPKDRVKASLRSPLMLPTVALVDPELTYDLSPAVTAATGLDALAQLIEPFVCKRANPLTDGLCHEGMTRVARSLRRAYEDGHDAAAREDMAVASLFGGLALANAGLGAVHGLAGPLGGMVVAPHGAICAALLPKVVATNLRALRERLPGSEALSRYQRVAQLLTGHADAIADDAVGWLDKLVDDVGIPGLGPYGVGPEIVAELIPKAERASSMKANPVELNSDELASIVESAL